MSFKSRSRRARGHKRIFSDADLETHIFGLHFAESDVLSGLQVLERLRELQRSGQWSQLTESNVEQSFNERVFADVFGYRTLLAPDTSASSAEAVQIPKVFVPLPGGRAFPDVGLGWFRADSEQIVVTAELKGPGADLDQPQSGGYGGKSAVAQALEAAIGAEAEWTIVSNFEEVRLYRVPDSCAYESVRLSEIESPTQMRRALALFSRRSLLGTPETRSPLTLLYERHQKGGSMLVPERVDRVRLTQRVRPEGLEEEFPFTRLSAALDRARTAVPALNILGGALLKPELRDGVLRRDRLSRQGEVWQRISVVKSGVIVCSYSVPLAEGTGDPEQSIYVDPAQIVELLADMAAFAWSFFEPLTSGRLVFSWTLEGLSDRVHANDGERWSNPACLACAFRCQSGVPRTAYPDIGWSHAAGVARQTVVDTLREALCELLFPFEARNQDDRLCRIEPSEAEMRQYMANQRSLSVFP